MPGDSIFSNAKQFSVFQIRHALLENDNPFHSKEKAAISKMKQQPDIKYYAILNVVSQPVYLNEYFADHLKQGGSNCHSTGWQYSY